MNDPAGMFEVAVAFAGLVGTLVGLARCDRARYREGNMREKMINASLKRRGGLLFLRLGDFRLSFCRVKR